MKILGQALRSWLHPSGIYCLDKIKDFESQLKFSLRPQNVLAQNFYANHLRFAYVLHMAKKYRYEMHA
jgi:hypothetical protein